MSETAASTVGPDLKPLAALTPMAHVADVARSVAWYAKLGFVAEHSWTPEGQPMQWAHLRSGGAELMLVRSDRPMNPGAQDVLFYLYAEGVAAYRENLIAQGADARCAEFSVLREHGEFRIDDRDEYCLLVGDTERQ